MAKLGFIYLFTDSISEMKTFYAELLELDLIWDEVDNIAFNLEAFQLSIYWHEDFKRLAPAFAIQPGWKGGSDPRISWSIAYNKDKYQEVITQLQQLKTPAYFETPQWRGYWSYPVLDPMNHTIEITCSDEGLNF